MSEPRSEAGFSRRQGKKVSEFSFENSGKGRSMTYTAIQFRAVDVGANDTDEIDTETASEWVTE